MAKEFERKGGFEFWESQYFHYHIIIINLNFRDASRIVKLWRCLTIPHLNSPQTESNFISSTICFFWDFGRVIK